MLYNYFNRLYNYSKMDNLSTEKACQFNLKISLIRGVGYHFILIFNKDREYNQWFNLEMYKW